MNIPKELELVAGNVSYYFARKENPVKELMFELARENTNNVAKLASAASLPELLDQYREIFRTQYDCRCLSRSVVQIVDTYPEIGSTYATVDAARRQGLTEAFSRLVGKDLVVRL